MTSGSGLIGRWSPGIGDPSVVGWVTVALYFYTAYRCFRLARGKNLAHHEARIWWLFTAALIALGINKQLDLQSAFTEIGRILARQEGWYKQRRDVQVAFIACVGFLGFVAVCCFVWITRRLPIATRVAVAGGVGLVAFVVIRAASLHHIDELMRSRLFGAKLSWTLEIGSISIILAATYFRQASSRTAEASSDFRHAPSQG